MATRPSFENPPNNFPPPGIDDLVRRKKNVIPFRPGLGGEQKVSEISREKFPEQKSDSEMINRWWDDNEKKWRETWKFAAAEIGKENTQKTFTADYWITERSSSKVSKMVPGTLKEVS